jgi:hypothetical protein
MDDRDALADPDLPDEEIAEAAADWRGTLAPEMQSFARQFASPADAVRTALDLRQKLSTAVQIPAADADPARRLEIFDRLGRPASPDDYEVAMPDGLPDWVDPGGEAVQTAQRSFLEAMHAAGATQEMVETALGWYWRHFADSEAARDRGLEEDYAAAEAGLRREWGRDFERNVEHAERAVAAFGGRALSEALDRYGLSSHPAVVRAFARIGRTMGEDDMISGTISDTTRDQMRRRAEELVSEDDYWTNSASQREMREIMLRLYGEKEIGPGVA